MGYGGGELSRGPGANLRRAVPHLIGPAGVIYGSVPLRRIPMLVKQPHIIIIGAGIVGASLAYHLSRKNVSVTLLDKAAKLAAGATEKSFAWVNVAHDAPETYLRLRQQAIADWHRVEAAFEGKLAGNWSGALTWYDEPAETARIGQRLLSAGYAVRLVDQAEIRRLEPNLRTVPAQALFAENEGVIEPIIATELLVSAAQAAGAHVRLGTEVLGLAFDGERIAGVVTRNGSLVADSVVLAAGASAAALCQPLGLRLPLAASPAILLDFHTSQAFVNRIVSMPGMEIRAASATRLVAAEDYVDESVENCPSAIGRRTLQAIKKQWRTAEATTLVSASVGQRPMPADGLPIVGRVGHLAGLYLAVMHAGVTLAALIGRLAATELVSGQDEALLAACRLERFSGVR